MKTKYFKNAEFWTREFRLPLFWLPKITKTNSLVLYKKLVVHIYYINDRDKKDAESGHSFFTNKNCASKHKKEINNILLGIKDIVSFYKELNMSKINGQELRSRFIELVNFLTKYSDIYLKTEAVRLSRLENKQNKYKRLIARLGKERFVLRKKGESIFYILLGKILKEIAKRFGMKWFDLFFYTYDEMLDLFGGRKAGKEIIEKRKRGYALVILKNKEILLTGEKFKKLFKEIVIQKRKIKEFSGQIAMKGFAKGNTRLILHNKRDISEEVAKFKKGEILITEMTRPDTILACKKALAIITDEGGILSHAAIVSRELKIPCIVGAKISTRVLKTGDSIEVDAYKGVVKILSRK